MNLRFLFTTVSVALLSVALVSPAHAATPFDGKVLFATEALPTSARTERALYRKLRRKKTNRFTVSSGQSKLKVHYLGFFESPLSDRTVTVNLYEVAASGQKTLKRSNDVLLASVETSALPGKLRLAMPEYGDRTLRVELVNGGAVIASANFTTVGNGQ